MVVYIHIKLTHNQPLSKQLETQLEAQEDERNKSQRSVRNVDRTVKDLQSQLERKDKQNGQLQDDLGRMRDKVDKLLKAIDDLQAADSAYQLNARRAERDLREEREERLRLERELEGWKSLRLDKNGTGGPPSSAGSVINGFGGGGGGGGGGSTRRNTATGIGISGGAGGSLRHSVLGLASTFEAAATAEEGGPNGLEIPKRKSSISRVPSLTKGFL